MGLTEQDETQGQIVRSCLEEIDRCRPYFIGITGDRYGFIPTQTENLQGSGPSRTLSVD